MDYKKLPPDIQEKVLEYYNPYRIYFHNNVLSNIWKSSWLRFYKNVNDVEFKHVLYYILRTWNITPSSNKSKSNLLMYKNQENILRKSYFTTDIQYNMSTITTQKKINRSYTDTNVFIQNPLSDTVDILFYGLISQYYGDENPVEDDEDDVHWTLLDRFSQVYYNKSDGVKLYKYLYDQTWSSRMQVDVSFTYNPYNANF